MVSFKGIMLLVTMALTFTSAATTQAPAPTAATTEAPAPTSKEVAETVAHKEEGGHSAFHCPDCPEGGPMWKGLPVKNSWCTETWSAVIVSLCAPVLSTIFIAVVFLRLMKQPDGTTADGTKPKQVMVADNIRLGSISYMKTQYKYIVAFCIVVAILIVALLRAPKDPFQGHKASNQTEIPYWQMMVHFLIGAALSGISGVLGMNVAIRANVRTCEACNTGPGSLNRGLRVAFDSGTVMGMAVVTFVVFGQAVLFLIFEDPLALSGFGFGASMVALFSRVGGGIFTKAADVGSDLVGKVEAGLPEDDPRNPGVIADNVGDNVGDVAGLGADLFESYVGATVAAVPLGYQMHGLAGVALPFWISGAGILFSIIGTFCVKTSDDASAVDLLSALRRGILVAGILILCASFPICWFLFEYDVTSAWQLWVCSTLGLVAGILVGSFTEYVTSDAYYPTRSIAVNGGRTGPATVIIRGIAVGMLSNIAPGIILAFTALGCHLLQGTYGVAIAAIGMLSTLGITLATDAYGPVADNAGGIAEMAGLPEEVRERTDKLDALGNTTAATGKGFAIGSALLITLALIAAFVEETNGEVINGVTQPLAVDFRDALTLTGGVIGALLPFIFAALTMFAVGSSAEELIVEVRRQFREIDGLKEGREGVDADHEKCIAICTTAALREMILPGVIAVCAPIAFGFTFGSKFIAGLLVGSILCGFFLAITMANAGGSWDNAKKYVEAGKLVYQGRVQGKGTDYHVATVVGDTVGDPFKDTSGPALNILSKLMSHLALIVSGALMPGFERWYVGVIIFGIMAIAALIVYLVSKARAPEFVIVSLEGVRFGSSGDNLKFQAALLQDLTAMTGEPKERFVFDEVYETPTGGTEITLNIVAGKGANAKAVYQKLSTADKSGRWMAQCSGIAQEYDVEAITKAFKAQKAEEHEAESEAEADVPPAAAHAEAEGADAAESDVLLHAQPES